MGFGFLEGTKGGLLRAPQTPEPVHVAVPLDRDAGISVPLPEQAVALATEVVVRLRRNGEALLQAGIPIWIERDGGSTNEDPDLRGSTCAVTDRRGEVVVRLFPGQYLVYGSPSVVRSSRETLHLRTSSTRRTLDLSVDHPQ